MAASPPPLAGNPTGPLNPGKLLANRYLVERMLGGGGMGVVYLARDQRLANRPCAIKEMVDHFIDQQQRLEANDYFAREADTLAQLKHQAIPAITDRFDDQNRHYLVMEYVEGRNLEEELAARGGDPLPEGLVIDIVRQLCDVLGYLHNMTPPVVYRDMKPSNVMLTPKGRVVLVDFGIARLFKAARKGTMIGTLGFAPPEQYKGEVDPRSDIYSLAATMHYMLTARDPEKFPPFSFPKLRELRPDASSNLAAAIDSALCYNVEGRPQTIEAFRDMMLYGAGISASGAVVNSQAGTAGLPPVAIGDIGELPIAPRAPRGAVRRAFGLITFSLVLAGIAFGATYVYSDPMLQLRLGIKPLIDSLPWKHEELLAEARQHPLEFQQMSVMLSSRDGTPVSAPKASFTDLEISNQKYLKWQATFKNDLHGLEGRNDNVEARFYDAGGHQIASSDQSLFVGPSQKTVDFSGVALMPDLTSRAAGAYRVALYLGDKYLAAQQFTVTQDLANKAKSASDAITTPATVSPADAAKKAAAEEKRYAYIQEVRRKPLELQHIEFLNSTKTGTPLSSPAESFDVSKVLFVGWQVNFKNRLYKLDANQYRVDAAYIAPDGRTLGSVNDWKNVPATDRTVTFSGRVGNSAGGAFLPGTYTVNFYLNGQYFAQKRFEVLADTGGSPYAVPPSGSSAGGGLIPPSLGSGAISSGPALSGPTVAKGNITGLGGSGNSDMELRLRPQPNGFLHGELTVHKSGFGATPIEGFVRGNHLQFTVPYGTDTYYFEGETRGGNLSGTFESGPSGGRGTWTARAY
jgi:serine/threonine protein kinase